MTKINIIQPQGQEVPVDVLASEIKTIAEGVRRLRSGRLNDRALFLLVQNAAPGDVSMSAIKAVFAGIDSLEATYLKKTKP